MSRKNTQRHRQCQAITSRKAKQKRWDYFRKRGLMALSVTAAAYVLLGGYWLVRDGQLAHAMEVGAKAFWGFTADAGFALQKIAVEGRGDTPMPDVLKAMNVRRREPILAVDLQAMKARLEALPEIASVRIDRTLPDSLHVQINERQPVAIWQDNGKQQLIDLDGKVLMHKKLKPGQQILVLAGDDVPQNTRALLSMLVETPELMHEIRSAVRVGDRRWNLKLNSGVTVLLPEENPQAALRQFAAMVREQGLLNKAIESVDLRIEDRVFMKVTPQVTDKPSSKGARDV